jgi:hypothetical protein
MLAMALLAVAVTLSDTRVESLKSTVNGASYRLSVGVLPDWTRPPGQ